MRLTVQATPVVLLLEQHGNESHAVVEPPRTGATPPTQFAALDHTPVTSTGPGGPDTHAYCACAIAAGNIPVTIMQAKQVTARFFADHLLSQAPALRDAIVHGAESVMALPMDAF